MSELHQIHSPKFKNRIIIKSSENDNPPKVSKKIISQRQIINSTKTKKIIIPKNENSFQNSPKRIINSSRIYNRRMVSPRLNKPNQKNKNKIYQINPSEEVKEEIESNYNNAYMKVHKNNTNGIIYNKEDFNNNNFYEKESIIGNNKENRCNKVETTLSFDLIKNKQLSKYNYNYISPKKDSKVLLKSVFVNPISVLYTEINDAELKQNKEQVEEIEETEITIKNKIIKIWEGINKVINETHFSLIGEEDSNKNDFIPLYEKKIKELNEIISNLSKEKELNQNNELPDNKIQSFNFQLKRKSLKSKANLFSINNIDRIFINQKPKFKNIKQTINTIYISSSLDNQKSLVNNTGKIKINSKNDKRLDQIEENLIDVIKKEKINDIYIPGQKKEKFTSDKIYGQELCILAKKRNINLSIIHKDYIQLYQIEEKRSLEINNIENISLIGNNNILKKKIINKIQQRDKIKLLGKNPEKNKIQKKVSIFEICPLPKILKLEETNSLLIPGLNKPDNIIEQNEKLFIESTSKIFELNIEPIDNIYLEEIIREKYEIKQENEIIILREKNENILFVENLEKFILEGKGIPIYEIQKNQEIELLRTYKLYSKLKEMEKVDDFYFHIDIKYINNLFDIAIVDDIFYDEMPKPENEIQELEGFSLINKKEKSGEISIYPNKKLFIDYYIDKNDSFIIWSDKNNNEDLDYIEDFKKSKFFSLNNNNNLISDNCEIINTANFQIISMSIRELYQQRLQGFSIIGKGNELYTMNIKKNFMNFNDNFSYINKNKLNNYYYNKNDNLDLNKQIQNERLMNNNRTENTFNNKGIKNINTFRSINYKTFLAFPKSNVDYINSVDIFNDNQKNNDYCYSDDEFMKANRFLNCSKHNKRVVNKNINGNKLNKRFHSKIILRNSNNNISLKNTNNNSIKSYTYGQKNYYNNKKDGQYKISTPKKEKNDQNQKEYKALTENRVYRRKIYRFEEGKRVEILNK